MKFDILIREVSTKVAKLHEVNKVLPNYYYFLNTSIH
jgi:hypothetical protein